MSREIKKYLEKNFPKLKSSYYKITSPHDQNYNCIAYAAGDLRSWWDPFSAIPPKRKHWPTSAPRDMSLNTMREIFAGLGYSVCGTGEYEKGFEKVAFYGTDGVVRHAAKQLPNGAWSSKLGEHVDIRHNTVSAISGATYGEIIQFMQRPVTQKES